jgi:pyruvate dehydrogenase E1 component
MAEEERGRFVALIGDAELDEGNIYECLIEAHKHDIRNCWWIVDYNRQSLDATSADRMFERFDEIFRSCGWRTIELRYGKKLSTALARSPAIAEWLDALPNADHSALLYQAARPGGQGSKQTSARRRPLCSRPLTTKRWAR